eukprot:TRINITY_DN7151_c0_g2_i1.p1 TRINITY_DN7151_c0_g2~~TRINITY_DN7151_c0_g2_i1.p1  ORF type:complete len:141 (-),score=6.00 TRINITY_DN7151_c0_g2_i1:222-644(-)
MLACVTGTRRCCARLMFSVAVVSWIIKPSDAYRKREKHVQDESAYTRRSATAPCRNISGPDSIDGIIGPSCPADGVNKNCGCHIACKCRLYEKCYSEGWDYEFDGFSQRVGRCGLAPWLYWTAGIMILAGVVWLCVLLVS